MCREREGGSNTASIDRTDIVSLSQHSSSPVFVAMRKCTSAVNRWTNSAPPDVLVFFFRFIEVLAIVVFISNCRCHGRCQFPADG